MPGSLLVSKHLRFDSRLALYHETDRWLAIADPHYGYELSQRAAGALFPAWGMQEIERRLDSLIADYQPRSILFLGDLVHTAVAEAPFLKWIARIEDSASELILLRGNHDRHLKSLFLHDFWRIGTASFFHGHSSVSSSSDAITFSGHLHPAHSITDGAGLRKKLPALLQTAQGYILPAFSPWAAGGISQGMSVSAVWCALGGGIIRADLRL